MAHLSCHRLASELTVGVGKVLLTHITLGSCIFKADFKILFRNFTKYLRYCAAVDHKMRRKP
jgi:hypothetical protein